MLLGGDLDIWIVGYDLTVLRQLWMWESMDGRDRD